MFNIYRSGGADCIVRHVATTHLNCVSFMGIFMKYVEGSLKPGKPYRQRRMTNGNCAISVTEQVCRYLSKMTNRTIHVWPTGPQGHAKDTLDYLMLHTTAVSLVEVNPEDWK